MSFLRNRGAILIVALALIAIGAGFYGVYLGSMSKSVPSALPLGTPASQTVLATPVAVAQPPSAKDVAASLNCKNFQDHGASQVGGVVDSGTCWKDGIEYAIDTFPSRSVRDAWLPTAEQFGVNPKWETDTSVTYKSVPA